MPQGKENRQAYYITNREKIRTKSKQQYNNMRRQMFEHSQQEANRHAESCAQYEQQRIQEKSHKLKQSLERRQQLKQESKQEQKQRQILERLRHLEKTDAPLKSVNRRRILLKTTYREPVSAKAQEGIRVWQDDKCAYFEFCGTFLKGGGHLDHRTPISRRGTHTQTNLQWTCAPCNLSKNNKTDAEYLTLLKAKTKLPPE